MLYALDVIGFNPMDHGCMFERFLNLDRVSLPDIDVDFGDRVRGHVVKYLVEKYGEQNVGKVASFSSLNIKSALKDVGRALQIPHQIVNRLTKLPLSQLEDLDNSVGNIMQSDSDEEKQLNERLITFSRGVEGIKRHVSHHASAVIIADEPLINHIPLFKDKKGEIATQFEGTVVEEVGMVKFDFLGSRSLMATHDCLDMINRNREEPLELQHIPFDDKETYDAINKG